MTVRIRFTNTDSTGAVVTQSLGVTIDGESYELTPDDEGICECPDVVGEYLLNSTAAVEPALEEKEAAARAAVLAADDEDGDETEG